MHDSEKDIENAKLELANLYLLIKIQKKENEKIYDYIKTFIYTSKNITI